MNNLSETDSNIPLCEQGVVLILLFTLQLVSLKYEHESKRELRRQKGFPFPGGWITFLGRVAFPVSRPPSPFQNDETLNCDKRSKYRKLKTFLEFKH